MAVVHNQRCMLKCQSRTICPESAHNPQKADDIIKDEYDLSKATRGNFYRENAELVAPVHLEPEVLKYLHDRAEARGTSLSRLVNELLKKDIELIEAVH